MGIQPGPCGLPTANLTWPMRRAPSPTRGPKYGGTQLESGPFPALAGLPGRHLKREEERERQALPSHGREGPHGSCAWGTFQLPGEKFHHPSPTIWNVPTRARWRSLSETLHILGLRWGATVCGKYTLPSYVPVTHSRLLPALGKTQAQKRKQRENSLCLALSSPRRNPGGSGRMERALKSRHTCRQVWL